MDNSRDRILFAASRLFAEKGIQAASLSQIARAAGIAKGTLHYYYPSKESLVAEVLNKSFSAAPKGFSELPQGEDLAGITRSLMKALTEHEENGRNFARVLQEVLGNPTFRSQFREHVRWREQWEEVFNHYGLDDPDLVSIFTAIQGGLFLQWLVYPDLVDPERLAPKIAGLFQR